MKVPGTLLFILLSLPACFGQRAAMHLDSVYAGKVIYDDVGSFRFGVAEAHYRGKLGFIDTNGNKLTDFKYGKALRRSRNKLLVESNGKLGIIDSSGRELLPCIFDFMYNQRSGMYYSELNLNKDIIVVKGNKFGLYYTSGEMAFPCIYDTIFYFRGNYAIAKLNGKFGVINKSGRVIAPFNFTDANLYYSEGMIAVADTVNGTKQWGVVDAANAKIIPCRYERVGNFSTGVAPVWKNGKCWFIDASGQQVFNSFYEDIRVGILDEFADGFASVKRNGKWGLINRNGTLVIQCQYANDIDNVIDGLAVVKNKDGKYGVIDTGNHIVIPFEYEHIGGYNDGRIRVSKNRKYGFVDRNNRVVVPIIYAYAGYFKRGVAEVEDTTLGYARPAPGYYIDTNGKKVEIAVLENTEQANRQPTGKYIQVEAFSDGLAAVLSGNNKWGFINEFGAEVIPCKYASVTQFVGGYSSVYSEGHHFIINKAGKEVFQGFPYRIVRAVQNNRLIVAGNDKYGVTDTNGKWIVPCKYNNVGQFSGRLIPVQLEGAIGYINRKGAWKIHYENSGRFYSGRYYYDRRYFGLYEDSIYDYGVHDHSVLSAISYSYLGDFREGLAPVSQNDSAGYIDRRGKTAIPFNFASAGEFKNGIALVSKKTKYGFKSGIIDKRGRLVFPWRYNILSNFSDDGLAVIKVNGRYGFISKTGELAIPCIYDFCPGMSEGKNALIPVYKNGQCGYIDKTGKRVLWFE